ncbi:MAG: hypothetical protein CMH54_08520 [Myxococcales bacterium]|nr:hypothetical protein [Myxococcales bacterium]
MLRWFTKGFLLVLLVVSLGCSGSSGTATDTTGTDSQSGDQGVDVPAVPDSSDAADTSSADEGNPIDTPGADTEEDVVDTDTITPPGAPAQGLLQLRVTHNMAEPGCVEQNNCGLDIEVSAAESAAWVEALSQHSNIPVLHWDRPMPWFAFSEDPVGDPVQFYNARMPIELREYVDAYAAAFSVGGGYLALTPLNGTRNAVKPQFVVGGESPVGAECDSMAPDQVFAVDLLGGLEPQDMILGSTYLNFVRYMYTRLQPAYLALGIEVNLYEEGCVDHPGAFDDFATLYHWIYDALRADGVEIPIFATFTLVDIMGFDENDCQGPGDFAACGSARPDFSSLDPATCFPIHRSSVDALDEGDRLDILALSYYPDHLRSSVEDDVLTLQSGDSNGDGPCVGVIHLADVPDPLDHLDLLGWDKPMVFAESGAHSCPVPLYFEPTVPGDDPLVLVLPGSPARQAHYMTTILDAATAHEMPFVVNAFLNDYPPLSPFVAREGIMPAPLVALFNTFSCMGIRDAEGNTKGGLPWGSP